MPIVAVPVKPKRIRAEQSSLAARQRCRPPATKHFRCAPRSARRRARRRSRPALRQAQANRLIAHLQQPFDLAAQQERFEVGLRAQLLVELNDAMWTRMARCWACSSDVAALTPTSSAPPLVRTCTPPSATGDTRTSISAESSIDQRRLRVLGGAGVGAGALVEPDLVVQLGDASHQVLRFSHRVADALIGFADQILDRLTDALNFRIRRFAERSPRWRGAASKPDRRRSPSAPTRIHPA